MLSYHRDHDTRTLIGVEVAGPEAEGRNCNPANLPRFDALQSAREGAPHAVGRDAFRPTHHDRMDEQLCLQLARRCHDGGANRQWLLETNLIVQLRSRGELESAQERRRRTEIFVHRPDDCLSVEEREIIDADSNHRRWASRALWYAAVASAGRPSLSRTIPTPFRAR